MKKILMIGTGGTIASGKTAEGLMPELTTKQLHRTTVQYVCAPAQAARMDRMLPLLTEEELAQYKRGRNAHTHMIPKNATHEQYSKATGLECLFGALYLAGKLERINELFVQTMEEPHAD